MRSLPPKAQLYLTAIYLSGVLSGASAVRVGLPRAHGQFWELALFAVAAAVIGNRKISLLRGRNEEADGCSMSLGFVFTFAAMCRFGPAGGVLIGAVSSLSNCLFPTRQALHQLAFNVALTVVEAWVAGQVFFWLNGHTLALDINRTFPAVVASCLLYYGINTWGVTLVIGLCTGQPMLALWKENFLWTAPSYFAGGSVSTLAMLLFSNHAVMILVSVAPVAYFIHQSYATYMARAEEKQAHIEELQRNQAHLADLYLATIKSLALAIDAKDQYTHQHILRVQRYSVAIARHMGLEGTELEGVNTGALLHDIGKLGVPEYVLLKPGRLTDDEFDKIKQHPQIGADILSPVEFPWPVLPVVKYHHEKWNGTGYPEGLKGEEIPLTARILAVGDVYDALTSSRSYRGAWTHERAVATITKDAGTHFDPEVVVAFLDVIDGVVAEMAAEGTGPLAAATTDTTLKAPSKADQAAQAISRTSSDLWALYEVAQTLSASLGLEETLDILGRKLEAIMTGTACLFLLNDASGGDTLAIRAAVGVNREFFVGGRTYGPFSRSVQVAHDRETYLGEYDSDDLLMTSAPAGQWVPLHSALIVPIVHEGDVLGTINLYHPQAEAFGPHDRQLLETIADRAAMALYNGLMFDRARSHALTDPLTGLYNLRYLTQSLEERCRRPDAAPFALLCLDLDSFKPINDNFGHQKGDAVLRDLSRLFQSAAGEGGVMARYGGDEFLLVLDGAGPREADAMRRTLQAAVEAYDPELYHPKLGALHLGISIGCACFPGDGTDSTALLSAADFDMYRCKTEHKLGSLAEPKGLDASHPEPLPRAA